MPWWGWHFQQLWEIDQAKILKMDQLQGAWEEAGKEDVTGLRLTDDPMSLDLILRRLGCIWSINCIPYGMNKICLLTATMLHWCLIYIYIWLWNPTVCWLCMQWWESPVELHQLVPDLCVCWGNQSNCVDSSYLCFLSPWLLWWYLANQCRSMEPLILELC